MNVVVVPSKDESFVGKIIPYLGILDHDIVLLGMKSWSNIDQLDIGTLMRLNTHVADYSFWNTNVSRNKNLSLSFEKKFNHSLDKYSLLSFQSLMHFCMSRDTYSSLPSHFKFYKLPGSGGYLNINIKILKYSDYLLSPVD